MSGHGWVTPRPDGTKARCGGPRLCPECSTEQAAPTYPINLKKRNHEERELYYLEKLSELVMAQSELTAVTRERDALREALVDLLELHEDHLKKPAATYARTTLSKLESGELRKPE